MTKKPNKIDIDKLTILGDNILLEPVELEDNEVVLKPEQYEDKPEFGLIISMGKNVQSVLTTGELVVFNKYSTTKIRVNGHDYLFIREEDVLGKQ